MLFLSWKTAILLCLTDALHLPHKGTGIDLVTRPRETPEYFTLCCSLLISKASLRKMDTRWRLRKDIRRDSGDCSAGNILTIQEWEPEFRSSTFMSKLDTVGRDVWVLWAHWSASLANPWTPGPRRDPDSNKKSRDWSRRQPLVISTCNVCICLGTSIHAHTQTWIHAYTSTHHTYTHNK